MIRRAPRSFSPLAVGIVPAALLVAALALAPPAPGAAFPGRSGLIAFSSGPLLGDHWIYSMRANGGPPRKLTNAGSASTRAEVIGPEAGPRSTSATGRLSAT